LKRGRICKLFKIDLPILQGGMLWLAGAELAGAVLQAGALGVVSPLAGMPKGANAIDNMAAHIQRLKHARLGPVAVNIPLDLQDSGLLIDQALKDRVDIVITAAGDPFLFTELLQNAGITVAHVVGSVKQARRAEAAGVAAVIASGYEAAAHIGFAAEPLMALIPQVVDAVSIPVVAAGGICDGRGMAAALALGAEGVQLGTRFAATVESLAHAHYKQALVEAATTVISCRSLLPTRSLSSPFTDQLLALEAAGADPAKLQQALGFRKSRESQILGDGTRGELYAGTGVGLIRQILPAAEVVRSMIQAYNEALARLSNLNQ
jgi:enoyl-[acyl-carrier protein] reductase II